MTKGYTILACKNNVLYTIAYVTSQGNAEIFVRSIKPDYDHIRIIDGKAKTSSFFIEDNLIFRKR